MSLSHLLTEFSDRLPLPARWSDELVEEGEEVEETVVGDGVKVEWIVKYTVLLRQRGLVADKG